MSSRIKLVQGDTRPSVIVDLLDNTTYDPIDVSAVGTNVYMRFFAADTTTILATLLAAKLPGQLMPDGTFDSSVVPAGSGGRVVFNWPAGTLNVAAGNYEGEVYIVFADGTVQTIYEKLRFYVREVV